ncbi:DUF2812 domain-containing protein [Fredinandcohnia sp. 179-A 10B2 NHS]|uniref:DUF2812 domain-containing protein n=1 Tax=Fredinandcohnia sp. 179-A 10B2 NHS TaxID=3235176 RepID=UPI0039A1EF8E
MIRKYRPLWSYDIPRIEQWLTQMAEKGYGLKGLNRFTRCFLFEEEEPKKLTYRIGYEKVQNKTLPTTLQKEGWKPAVQTGKWTFLANENEAKTSPVRDDIIRRNRIIMYLFSFLLVFMMGILLNPLVMFLSADEVIIVESPLWVVTYTFFGLVLAFVILGAVSILKIRRSNKQFLEEIHVKNTTEKVKGPFVVKYKFGWMYAPDKLEKWLEEMEEKGFNLKKVGKMGVTFYFSKGEPRKVAYALDYQNLSNESYFRIHQDSGWKKAYSSPSPLQKWTLWSCEYRKGEEKPQFYSDKTHLVKHARKVAMSYTALFLPLVIMYSLFISSYVYQILHDELSTLNTTNFVMQLFLIFVFGTFTVRTWLYYRRLKNSTGLA